VLLTQSGKAPFTSKAGKFPTKAARAALGPVAETLDALMDRVEHARVQRLAMEAADRSAALHGFAAQLLPRLDALKTRRALLDFDDLVLRVRDMLGTSDVAQWVLFRLDGGIDHILLDEAQDTSPAQWDIVRALAREFAAGHGARPDVTRTLFVVGDPKQSIYSFQGADPDGFAQMGAHFRQTLSAGGGTFQDADLRFSFRSAPAILRAVDAAFTATGHHGLGDASGHLAFNSDMPGRVDLWPAIPPADTREEVEDFDAPVDALSAEAPKAVLARQIADEIAVWVSRGVQITDRNGKTRPLHGGDILILVRRRDALFHEVIRALKARDLPVAGADRLRIGAELAVKDLVALLKVLATPEDDLSLAATLRSPLFGWSEQDLFTLAAGRGPVYLWQALREARDTHPRTLAVLDDLRARADFLRPFELIDRILTRHGGRQALLARLGAEAEDGIDALLSQALGFETTEVPSLTGFLGWLDADKSDFKRPAESGAGAIRVMTVHGAKGLEAPVVILPSCERQASGRGDAVLAPAPDGAPAWASARDSAPEVLREALDAQREAREAEEQRLLYVAMTRAESWLVVAAAGATARKTGGDGPLESWYETVKAGLETLGAVPAEMPGGQGLRWEDGAWPDRAPEPGAAGPAETGNLLPDWSAAPPAPDPTPPPPLASSALGGAKVLTGEQADAREVEAAMAHGTAVHWLLETLPTLPRGDWAAIGAREAPEAYAEAVAVLDDPALAPLFTSDWLSEVTLQAPLAALGATRVLGVLDRVRVTSDRVEIIDYKTNAHVPGSASDVPEGLLRQMGAYAALAEIAFPGRQIETAILWTRTRSLMPLPHELVMAALARAELP
jgi:ATP-dependent helicase/nuclease subunit A